jgi:hypothetical protein
MFGVCGFQNGGLQQFALLGNGPAVLDKIDA